MFLVIEPATQGGRVLKRCASTRRAVNAARAAADEHPGRPFEVVNVNGDRAEMVAEVINVGGHREVAWAAS